MKMRIYSTTPSSERGMHYFIARSHDVCSTRPPFPSATARVKRSEQRFGYFDEHKENHPLPRPGPTQKQDMEGEARFQVLGDAVLRMLECDWQ